MIATIFKLAILAHVSCGSVALASFWIPVFAPKGGRLHVQCGRLFAWSMMATAAFAGFAALLTGLWPLPTHPDAPAGAADNIRVLGGLMLGYLSVVTFIAAWSGWRAVRMKARYGGHRNRAELALNILGLVLAAVVLLVGVGRGASLMIGLSFIGLLGIPGNIKLILSRPQSPREWLYQHMGSMLGAGIAAHTAFLVFGVGRIFPELGLHVAVWLAPSLVGIPATIIWTRSYRRREQRGRSQPAGMGASVVG